MSDTLTHKDLAKLCGVSETTIKSYRRKFPTFIPVDTDGKPLRFKPEAGDVCLTIRDCFAKGMSVNATWKVLKDTFKEYRKDKRTPAAPKMPEAPATGSGVTQEYMEKFFETAGQMMHGMAQLATAQARADQRLRKLEKAIEDLVQAEVRNQDRFADMMTVLRDAPHQTEQTIPTPAAEEPLPEPPESATEQTTETQTPEQQEESSTEQHEEQEKPLARRRIVKVRGREGVKEYELGEETVPETSEAEEIPAPHREAAHNSLSAPSDTFMDTPIVIRNEHGEFLGVPGRLPLRGFIDILEKQAGNSSHRSTWERRERSWVYEMRAANEERHELYFGGTKTPRGNLVVTLWRLDVDGKETSQAFLQEFFRQIKDRITQ